MPHISVATINLSVISYACGSHTTPVLSMLTMAIYTVIHFCDYIVLGQICIQRFYL